MPQVSSEFARRDRCCQAGSRSGRHRGVPLRRQRLRHRQRSRQSSLADDLPHRICRSALVHNYCARPTSGCTAMAHRHVVNRGRRSTASGSEHSPKNNAHRSLRPSLRRRPALPRRASLCTSMVLALSKVGRLVSHAIGQAEARHLSESGPVPPFGPAHTDESHVESSAHRDHSVHRIRRRKADCGRSNSARSQGRRSAAIVGTLESP
jgi:hypothetical protein